jgi:hypothetical protein
VDGDRFHGVKVRKWNGTRKKEQVQIKSSVYLGTFSADLGTFSAEASNTRSDGKTFSSEILKTGSDGGTF